MCINPHIKHVKFLQTKTPTTETQARAQPGSTGQRREDSTQRMEVPRLRPHQQPLAQPDRRDHTVRQEVPRRDGGEQRRAELLQEDGLPAGSQTRHHHTARSRFVF